MRSIAKSPFSHKDGENAARLARRMSATAAAAMLALAALFFAAPRIASARCAPDSASNDRLYAAAGALYGVDPALLKAIARAESADNPRAVSSKGAQGLMQLMPSTAAEYDVADPFDPVDNLLGAARFLRSLQSSMMPARPGMPSLPVILAAYNAGPGAVQKFNGIPPYPETRDYVEKVLLLFLSDSCRPAAAPRASRPARARRITPAERDAHYLAEIENLRKLRDRTADSPDYPPSPRPIP
jgi:soluble lytic murein transglycosylase-like protein